MIFGDGEYNRDMDIAVNRREARTRYKKNF